MATIQFFGKPNCVNNNKQKSLLQAAGHTVQDNDILSQDWKPDQLRDYFGHAPIAEWFNMMAPVIKSKDFSIDNLSAAQALEAMVENPLLIRRPLMDLDGRKVCGFRFEEIDEIIGLSPAAGHKEEMQGLRNEDMATCPFQGNQPDCDQRQ
jgi:nitrogenase-associated protein